MDFYLLSLILIFYVYVPQKDVFLLLLLIFFV